MERLVEEILQQSCNICLTLCTHTNHIACLLIKEEETHFFSSLNGKVKLT